MKPIDALAASRVAVGAASWAAPGLAGKAFGLDVEANPQASYVARLFGVRDLILGVGALRASGAARRDWLLYGVACDVADAAAGVISGREGSLNKVSATLVTATAVAAAALGVAAVRAE